MKEEVVRYHITRTQKPSLEQIAEIEAASKLPIAYDEDNPEIDPVKTPELYSAALNAVAERNRRIAERMKAPA